jgi:type I restriction enzyme M protein
MEEKIDKESRRLLKQRFNYPIFFYEAEKVGISATGEEDLNELYPNNKKPKNIDKTALEHYNKFLKNPKPYLMGENY